MTLFDMTSRWRAGSPGALLLLLFIVLPIAPVQAEKLVFLGWLNYMDPELMDAYREKTGIEVIARSYNDDAQRDEIMASTKGEGIDILLVNGTVLENYVRKGWTTALPKGFAESLPDIEKRWWGAYPAAEWYAVPYFWGTLGIAYRSDLISQPMDSWMQLFQPRGNLQGKVGVMGAARETTGMALKALNASVNTKNSQDVDAALNLLRGQSRHVGEYGDWAMGTASKLLSGELHAAMMYSNSAQALQNQDARIKYVLPKEGGGIWVDYLVVSAKSKQKQAAWDFIRFINERDNALQLAYFTLFTTPNNKVMAMADDAYLSDKTINPPKARIAKSEFFTPLLKRRQRRMDDEFNAIVEQAAQ